MTELSSKKLLIKEAIRRLHEGADVEAVRREFKAALSLVTPTEIAQIEEELIAEGMPSEEIQRLCDIHLAVFREALEGERTLAAPGHPIHILMTEHNLILGFAGELRGTANEITNCREEAVPAIEQQINRLVGQLQDSASHYVREENVLFPYLERHGITQPPAIMWMEHDKIREMEKGIYQLGLRRAEMGRQEFGKQLSAAATALAEMLSSHFYKEGHILFPTSLRVMSGEEWKEARQQFDELGYTSFTPQSATAPLEEAIVTMLGAEPERKELIAFETGSLSKTEIESLLNTLPVDVTFVDKNDVVRYFSQSPERIFPRTKAVIGRSVQNCHPQKSLHVVNQILDDFRSGKRKSAEFWINLHGRMIYIRYFAVHDKEGQYLGCLEVTQNITAIQKLTGEKRLLD